jgi:hypothetical protein
LQDAESIELARQEGREFRSIRLAAEPDGSLKMCAQDMGPVVEEWWGDEDYEFWVTIPAASTRLLAQALLREKYIGRFDAVDDLRRFCEANGIDHRFDSWT